MKNTDFTTVDITMGQNVYTAFEALPNTFSHVLAEFIDNAIQSYRDCKPLLLEQDPDFKLKVNIDIDWDGEEKRATRVCITDNAAGINKDKYATAFMPAMKPTDNTGLNEFGMGLKTAALWLGNTWTVSTKALGEETERTVTFDITEVTDKELTSLPVFSKEVSFNEHYTVVEITNLNRNAPKAASLEKIKTELSSIYRKFLRNNELDIILCGNPIFFEEYEILYAPYYKDPDGQPIYWKKNIDFKFGKYRATGFLAILKTINKDHNRIVLLRRGRVIVGAETEGRYYSKYLSGSAGNFKDKRLFGELELEGFNVSFNKNDIQDKENLDALMFALSQEIRTKENDLSAQADYYREDIYHKQVKKLVKSHNNSPKKKREEIKVDKIVEYSSTPETKEVKEEYVIDKYQDTYTIGGVQYTLNVQYVADKHNHDLFWVDVSKKSSHIISCNINMAHIFFESFGQPNSAMIAVLKTLAISKFTAKELGDDSTRDLFNYFNKYIELTKV